MADKRYDKHLELAKEPWRWRARLMQTDLPASAFRVGLAITDGFMNKQTGRAFPGFEALADATKLPVRTVRSGVDALRKAGLIFTRKMSFDGSLEFHLAIPDRDRSDVNLSVRENCEGAEIGHTKGQKPDARSDVNLTHEGAEIGQVTYRIEPAEDNLRIEPENGSDRRSAADARCASLLRSESSSFQSEASAYVERQPSAANLFEMNGEFDHDDDPIPLPATYGEQGVFIAEMTGRRSAEAAAAVMARWRTDKTITRRIAREIVESCEAESIAS
ncbi:helix-turn-helix domain-containing protein [Rhizobium sp. WYCCWR 11290]|uniref:Helix-turn-helix domain-containing protein n=1 Tax=Rhizobium changzhiense TaxID=2692317 RepID=A0A7Z0RMN3_9HYPH|nr:helix-turn-helix domain-containing protein [Rhizobium changzhiense]NZD62920.1 helix-turn-helix domain-containing protein [Rhizobium changzhiense]